MRNLHASLLGVLFAASCGPAPSTVPLADRARAHVIADASDLIAGPKSGGAIGDLLIANSKVRFVVEAAGRARSWFPVGGALLDADRVRPGGGGDDRLQEMVTRLGALEVLYAESVEVANDGSDGNPAVIRVTGHDVPVPLLQSVTAQSPANVRAVTEYRLAPYAESLEIVTTVTDLSGAARSVPVGDAFILGDYVSLYAPVVGGDRQQLAFATGLRYFAAYGGTVSYGYVAPGSKVTLLVPQAEIFAVGAGQARLAANGSASVTRDFAVGAGDVPSLLPEIVRREGGDPTALGALDGTVAEAHTGAPVAGATVELSNAQGSYAMAVAGADGRFHAPLERGMYTYTTTAADRGSAQGSVDLASTASASADVRLGDTGRYALKIVDDAGHPSPARVRIAKSDGSGVGFFLSGDGGGGDVLPPGDYRAVFSRGYEWEAATVPFTVVAGQTVEVDATLSHVVDTRGWVALDSHTHTAISVDSQLDPRQRVRQALADGVELVVATDHDVLFDLGAVESDMNGGLAGAFATTIGTEISPVPGHINGYPVAPTAMADGSGYWPVRWWTEDAQHVFIEDVWPPAIFAGLRAKLGAEVVQINHPRSGQGLLNWVGYDPAAGLAAMDPSRFDMGWDAIEVCNAGCSADPSSDDAHALADWYSFLDQGYRKTAVGVSDAHGDGNFLGRARTMVAVLNDDPATLDREEAFAALKAGQAVVLDGAFVTATVRDDAGAQVPLGGLATATGATVTLHVHVEAPSWIPTDHLRVIANGSVVQEQPLPSKGVVRFDGDLAVAGLARDAWLVVIVDGDSPMAPVIDGNPRTITNAILVDRDGNGRFDPPRPAM